MQVAFQNLEQPQVTAGKKMRTSDLQTQGLDTASSLNGPGSRLL